MCKYCENYNRSFYDLDLNDIIIVDKAKYTFYGDGKPYPIPMNYCPACGRSLDKKIFQNGLGGNHENS